VNKNSSNRDKNRAKGLGTSEAPAKAEAAREKNSRWSGKGGRRSLTKKLGVVSLV